MEELIALCVRYHAIRSRASAAEILAGLEQQILATVFQVVSGPGGVASCGGLCTSTNP